LGQVLHRFQKPRIASTVQLRGSSAVRSPWFAGEKPMCRWMAYSGHSVPLETLLFKAEHNLIDQSMSSHSAETPTNGDGFGVGWYGLRDQPGLFRSTRPAWNDYNLRDLAAQIDARLFLAHVRATSLATIQETNCHPFRHGKWLFVHNGEIFGIEKMRRDLLFAVDPSLFEEILGTTDSELMFHLALTFGLESDPVGALSRMVGFVERVGRQHGVDESVWMTVAVSDGESIWAVRYASDGEAPTMYHSRDVQELALINPDVPRLLGEHARVVVSEPVGFAESWLEVPQATSVHVRGGRIDTCPFVPASD
jgi:glutamine amidotransferase